MLQIKCPKCGSQYLSYRQARGGQWSLHCKNCRHKWKSQAPAVFKDEMMTCIMCGKKRKANPNVSSNWRCIEMDTDKYYVCTDHFPPDNASAGQFEAAYAAILAKIAGLRGQ